MIPVRVTISGVLMTRHGGPEALVWRDDITVPQTYPRHEIDRAQEDLAAGRYPGKLVLVPPETAP